LQRCNAAQLNKPIQAFQCLLLHIVWLEALLKQLLPLLPARKLLHSASYHLLLVGHIPIQSSIAQERCCYLAGLLGVEVHAALSHVHFVVPY
jgi:hypothetical protein